MEAEKDKPEAAGTKTGVMEGTKEMGYWQFKKDICSQEGWQLRRIDSQTYEVIDSKHAKIGMFRSGEGYMPNPEGVEDSGTSPEIA